MRRWRDTWRDSPTHYAATMWKWVGVSTRRRRLRRWRDRCVVVVVVVQHSIDPPPPLPPSSFWLSNEKRRRRRRRRTWQRDSHPHSLLVVSVWRCCVHKCVRTARWRFSTLSKVLDWIAATRLQQQQQRHSLQINELLLWRWWWWWCLCWYWKRDWLDCCSRGGSY